MRIINVSTQNGEIRFDCAICQAISWCDILHMGVQRKMSTEACMLVCRACGGGSIWKRFAKRDSFNYNLRLVDPVIPSAPRASLNMPEDVSKDYEEARLVAAYSPRSAAALLRLALQKLCRHLGEPGDHIDTDIRSLAKRPEFGNRLIKAADTLGIAGNNAVHPGEMD